MALISLSGGAALERKLLALKANCQKAHKVDIGFMKNSPYPNGKSLGEVAITNEYGNPAKGQPPRPFFRRMIAKHNGEWAAQLAAFLEANNFNADIGLNKMGGVIANELRQSIVDLVEPPLAPATIKRKGFDKPLVESGHLLASVDHEVS